MARARRNRKLEAEREKKRAGETSRRLSLQSSRLFLRAQSRAKTGGDLKESLEGEWRVPLRLMHFAHPTSKGTFLALINNGGEKKRGGGRLGAVKHARLLLCFPLSGGRAQNIRSNLEPLDEVAPGLLQQAVARHQVLAPAELSKPGVGVGDHRVVRVERGQEVEARRHHRPSVDGPGLAVGGLGGERLERRHARGGVVVGHGLRSAEGLQRGDVGGAIRGGPGGDRGRAQLDMVGWRERGSRVGGDARI